MALITRDYSGEAIGHLGRAYLKVYMAHNKSFGRDAMSLPEFLALCARHRFQVRSLPSGSMRVVDSLGG
jgi:hypothetical protein